MQMVQNLGEHLQMYNTVTLQLVMLLCDEDMHFYKKSQITRLHGGPIRK